MTTFMVQPYTRPLVEEITYTSSVVYVGNVKKYGKVADTTRSMKLQLMAAGVCEENVLNIFSLSGTKRLNNNTVAFVETST